MNTVTGTKPTPTTAKISPKANLDQAIGDTSLIDLQKFIADELAGTTDTPIDYHRSFLPLTNGLGLENAPKARRAHEPEYATYHAPKTEQPGPQRHTHTASKQLPQLLGEELETPVVESFQTPEEKEARAERVEAVFANSQVAPPPVPKVSLMRRTLAGLIDYCVVVFFWLVAVSAASNAFADGAFVTDRLVKFFAHPESVRTAIGVWFAVWLVYPAVCLAFGNATFGMWTWGVRMGFAGSRFGGKAKRLFLGLFFFPVVATTPVLAMRKRGDNFVDIFSGTHLYRSGA